MNKINKQAVDELENKFQIERALLVGCSTKFGAFERIATRILPMLQNDPLTKGIVKQWDELNGDPTMLVRAYTEMDNACQQIRNGMDLHPSWREGANQILEEVRRSGSCFDLSKDVPPCHRVYYKLRSLYVLAISKSWETTFAPSAWQIIQESSKGELAIKTDSGPRHIWKQLRVFEDCWAIRNDVHSIAWPEARGDGVEMWLNADSGYRIALRNRLAADFSFAHHYGPDRKTEFFQRESLEQWVDRLLIEIILFLRQSVEGKTEIIVASPKPGQDEHWRSKKEREDLDRLYPIAHEVWTCSLQNCPDISGLSQKNIAAKIKEIVDAKAIALHSYTPSRFKKAAKRSDPREWVNGKYMGRKRS